MVCATVAFGMGMDIEGISLIVHWDAAQSLNEYIQQIGRGGRCGCECLCITMYDRQFMQRCSKRALKNDKDGRATQFKSVTQVSFSELNDSNCS